MRTDGATVITFDYDKKCKKCKQAGASDSGYCLTCVADIVLKRLKEERDKKK